MLKPIQLFDSGQSASSCHAIVNDATRARHRALDRHPCLRGLLSANITTPQYTKALNHLRRGFATVESSLLDWEREIEPVDQLRYTPRTPAIENDLRALDSLPDRVTTRTIAVSSTGFYLGMRYVLEGSARGGVHIAGVVARRLPQVEARAFEFWRLQVRQAKDWEAFLERLSELDNSASSIREAVSGAKTAFDVFLRAMKEPRSAA